MCDVTLGTVDYFNTHLKSSFISQWVPMCSLQINWFGKYFLKTKMWFFFFCTLLLRLFSAKQFKFSFTLFTFEYEHIFGFNVCVRNIDFYTDHPLRPQVWQYPSSIHKFLYSTLFLICTLGGQSQWSQCTTEWTFTTRALRQSWQNHSSVWIAQIFEEIKECCGNSISGAGFYALTG